MGKGATCRIVTVCFDGADSVVKPVGVCADYDTGSPFPTFAAIKPIAFQKSLLEA